MRQPRFRASRASPAQKSRGLMVVLLQKLFKGYIFCFLVHSVGGYVFELFARETNLKKKRSVKQFGTGTIFKYITFGLTKKNWTSTNYFGTCRRTRHTSLLKTQTVNCEKKNRTCTRALTLAYVQCAFEKHF